MPWMLLCDYGVTLGMCHSWQPSALVKPHEFWQNSNLFRFTLNYGLGSQSLTRQCEKYTHSIHWRISCYILWFWGAGWTGAPLFPKKESNFLSTVGFCPDMCSLTTSTEDWYSPHFTDNITELGNLLGATLLIRGRVRIHTRQLNIGTCAARPGLYRMLLSEERLGFTDIRARSRSKARYQEEQAFLIWD